MWPARFADYTSRQLPPDVRCVPVPSRSPLLDNTVVCAHQSAPVGSLTLTSFPLFRVSPLFWLLPAGLRQTIIMPELSGLRNAAAEFHATPITPVDSNPTRRHGEIVENGKAQGFQMAEGSLGDSVCPWQVLACLADNCQRSSRWKREPIKEIRGHSSRLGWTPPKAVFWNQYFNGDFGQVFEE